MEEAPNKETPAHLEAHKNGTIGREKVIYLHEKRQMSLSKKTTEKVSTRATLYIYKQLSGTWSSVVV